MKDQLNGFAQQIVASGIDVHVVIIAGPPGTENGFCIPAPLGSGGCPNDDNLPTLLHVKQHVGSSDALIQILSRFDDYKSMLRHDASKHVVVISDDDSAIGAAQFDSELKAKDPMMADYVFHAIASSEDDPGSWSCMWNSHPCCDVAADEGKVYKQLVAMTQGIFGDLCEQNFQPVWNQLSTQVVQTATLACEWDIPEPPQGQQFDPALVNVQLAVNGGGLQPLGYVDSFAGCASVSGGWTYDDPNSPAKIVVCPDTCAVVQSAEAAEISIEFGCQTIPATPA
ncbi:MAG: hypothetical protein JRI68_09405 [Deltaproteobacteria bacterium]|nr:hypothetical protein [Deltaproteobacteria bacterium]